MPNICRKVVNFFELHLITLNLFLFNILCNPLNTGAFSSF
jgi:hypothetical protein